MMEIKRKTIENDEKYLRQISTSIDFDKDNYLEYIRILKEYCNIHSCYALAPVQIGIPKRIIYIRNTHESMDNNVLKEYDENVVYINPVIISEKGQTRFLEGCASCMIRENGMEVFYVGIVDRPYSIKIEYYDIDGNKQNKTIEGFEATIFSHEYDHLDGILQIDKTNNFFKMTLDEMKEYRNTHSYEIISKY